MRFLDIALIAIFVISALLNLFLGYQVSELRNANSELLESRRLVIGSQLASLKIIDEADASSEINFMNESKPSIVYFYSGECKWCTYNWPVMQSLIGQLADSYRVILLCTDETIDTCRNSFKDLRPSHLTVYRVHFNTNLLSFDVSGVPTTIVASPEGKVLRVWKGAVQSDERQELESFFRVSLPDLSE